MQAQAPQPAARSRTPARRRKRWRIAGIVVVLLVVAYLVLTRTAVTRMLVLGRLGAALGGDLSATSLVVSSDGHVVARGCVLRAPGIAGPAGELLTIDTLEADVEPWSVVRGAPVVKRVVLDSPRARLSQSIDDNTLNVAALKPREGGSGLPRSFPLVVVRSGLVELGEHTADPKRLAAGESPFRSLRTIPVSGEVERAPGEKGEMLISFRELDGQGNPLAGPGGLQIQGRVSPDEVSLNLGVISLSGWSADTLPSPIRQAFRDLHLEGIVYGAEMTYANAGGVEVRANLSGVAITLPVECQPDVDADGHELPMPPQDRGRRLRMQHVTGTLALTNDQVRGTFDGLVEDLPYKVEFRSQGASATAPFTCRVRCENFKVETKPQVLRFAPGLVRRRLEQFSNPTGLVDADFTVSRGDPKGEQAAPVNVAGTLRFRRATAAFERFPYRFTNMTGELVFTEDSLEIRRIAGDSPAGATVEATGLIAPLTDAAGVDVRVKVKGLVIDAALAKAMQARGRLVDALCNARAFDALASKGLVHAGATGPGVAFTLGGAVDVEARITRAKGPDSEWHDTVTIALGEVGILSPQVPYPMIARGVTIVKEDDIATAQGGHLDGAAGGTVQLAARADLAALTDPARAFTPELELVATDLPADDLLLGAVGALPGAESVAASLRALGLSGHVGVEAKVRAGEQGTVHAEADVRAASLTASPRAIDAGAPRVAARRIDGVISLTAGSVQGSLDAELETPEGQPLGRANLRLAIALDPDGHANDLSVNASARNLDLRTPIEDLIACFAPEAGGAIADSRKERVFGGLSDVEVHVTRHQAAETRVDATFTRMNGVSILTPGGRLGLTCTSGTMSLTRAGDHEPVFEFRGWEGTLTADGNPDGSATLDGALTASGGPAGGPLHIHLVGGRFESPIIRWLAGRSIPGIDALASKATPRGVFDLDLTLEPAPDGGWTARGWLDVKRVAMRVGGQELAVELPAGRVEFSPGQGVVRGVTFAGEGWSGSLGGGWAAIAEGGRAVQAELRLTSQDGTARILGLLPDGLAEVFKDLQVHVDGPLALEPLTLSLAYGADGTLRTFSAKGLARVTDLSLEPGLKLAHGTGTIEFQASRRDPASPPEFELWSLLDTVVVSNVTMTSARARVVGDEQGRVLVPHFSADCHGGRFSGEGSVTPDAGTGRSYTSTAQLSGVRFASVLKDLRVGTAGAPADDALPDGSRGLLDANVTLTGKLNDPASRRGRGTGTLAGGRILSIPLLVPLIRVTNLELPLDEQLDFGQAEFYLKGDFINFEALSLFSRSVEVFGFGTMQWPSTELDLRFRPKARTRIPILTPAIEAIRNELVAAEVQGTLAKPDVTYRALGRTTRFIGLMFGESPTEQERRLSDIEKRSEGAARPRPAPDEAIGTGPK